MSRRRAGVLWLVLFGIYAGTLGIHGADDHRFAGDEPHYLLMAQSIASDGDIDLRNQYAKREYRGFYRDAKILTIGEGTDEVQQMVIARALGA